MNGRLAAVLAASALLLADAFFLAMFLAAAPLERLADAGIVVAPSQQSSVALAYAYAAQWRHGMAGNSPVYMPGFFAAAIALWFWSMDKTLRRVVLEGAALLAASLAVAGLAARPLAGAALRSFQGDTGCFVTILPDTPVALASFQGVYTLIAWSTVVAGSRIALERRSLRPLGVAVVANVILAVVRPWTVDDFASYWWRQTAVGDLTAVFSSALMVLVAGALAISELAHERRASRTRTLGAGKPAIEGPTGL